MDIPLEIDDYIKESIQYSLGLPISAQTLELKLQACLEAQNQLHGRCLYLRSKLKEKDEIIERTRAEASMNALALKKFVEENQKLAFECTNLLGQCSKWEKECALYDHDREALMDFGNEADERAKESEMRVRVLEEELSRLVDELRFYKHEYELRAVDSSVQGAAVEENLLESVLATLVNEDGGATTAHAFLEANSEHEPCQKLLKMWNHLKPSTQRVLSLAAELKTLEKDKEHLRINLHTAEEEVKLLFDANNALDEENKRLSRKYLKLKEQQTDPGSGGRHTGSASAKGNKRRCGAQSHNSPAEKKIDFTDLDSSRQPLSPLQQNSPNPRLHKK